jgi:hypothetical protein
MLVALHLVDLESDQIGQEQAAAETMVFVWAMRDFTWTAGARYRIGQRLTLQLRAWSEVASELATVNRSEIYDDGLAFQVHCWGEEVEP